jgi:hypothetical protein
MPPNLSHLYVRAANEEPLVQDATPATGGNEQGALMKTDTAKNVNKVDVIAHQLTGE